MTDKKTIKLGDISKEVKLTTKDPIADGYERYIGLEHLDSGSLKIKRWGMIAEDNPSFTRVFKRGHILLGKRRPYLKKAAIAEFDGICSSDIIVMEGQSDVLTNRVIPFVIQSEHFWSHAVATSSGSLSPRTKYKELEKYTLLSLDSKVALVSTLEATETTLEKTYEALESAGALLNRLRKAHFSSSKHKVKLSDIADVVMGQSPKGSNCYETNSKDRLPLLNGPTEFGCVSPIPVQYTDQITKVAPADSVLFCVRGSTTGRMNIADQVYCIGRGLAAISTKSEKVEQRYIYHVLTFVKDAIFEQAKGAGSTFPNISGNDLKSWELPDLSAEKMRQVVKVLDAQVSVMDELSKKVETIKLIQSCLMNLG
ncbi:restriction endonuclease subunit S [Vibrio lentus]